MKQRIEYIDAIKGFAIFLMVMGHAIAWNYENYNAICNFHSEQSTNVKMGG
jgi:fucose 4-O-acetylase-like acetyltransferase